MKIKEVIQAAQIAIDANMYLALRYSDGEVLGFNPKLLNVKRIPRDLPDKDSRFQSFRLISFSEYISIKKPIL